MAFRPHQTMNSGSDYVELDRRFRVLSRNAKVEELASRSYSGELEWEPETDELTWSDLLKHRLVVVLGEPDSGKSFEFKHQASLATEDVQRFYIDLKSIADAHAGHEISQAERSRLQAWQSSNKDAIFFLDSVDEAKYHRISDFYKAIDRVVEMIGNDALPRTRIAISSRITHWLPMADQSAVHSRFQITSSRLADPNDSTTPDPDAPCVVHLLPLNRISVERLASVRIPDKANAFVSALDESHAWILAARPGDIDDLLAYWKQNGNLGTLTEILSYSCERRLRKTSNRERIENLSYQRALEGAQCLAAATVMCRCFAFHIPGNTRAEIQAIDAMDCLPPDWRSDEAGDLLNHALFDVASLGSIRFHHRRLSEFLAAQWFESLLNRGCPVSEVESLLFESVERGMVLRQSQAPIAAWLSTGSNPWNAAIARKTIKIAPEVFLRFGDPAALSTEQKKSLLKELNMRLGADRRIWWGRDRVALARLAHPDVSDDLCEILCSVSAGIGVKKLVIEIIAAGELRECSNCLLKAAVDDLTKGNIFTTAAFALQKVASDPQLEDLNEHLGQVTSLPTEVCVSLCELMFPRVWSVADLFRMLDRLSSQGTSGWSDDYLIAGHLAAVATTANAGDLLKQLLLRMREDDSDSDGFEPGSALEVATAVAMAMIDWPELSARESEAVAEVLFRIADKPGHFRIDRSITEKTKRHLTLRRSYFLKAAERLLRHHGISDPVPSLVAFGHGLIKPADCDLEWILEWIGEANDDEGRRKSLRWSLDVYQHLGRPRGCLRRIRMASKPFPKLYRELRMHIDPGPVRRIKIWWLRTMRSQRYKFWILMLRRKWKLAIRQLHFRWILWRTRDGMRAGTRADLIADVVFSAPRENSHKHLPVPWSAIQKKVGRACCRAAREGAKRVWQTYLPPLPHESGYTSRATNGSLTGLAGLEASLEDGDCFIAGMSAGEARRATRYALCEMNGFTEWFEDLTRSKPDSVQAVLVECIDGEWLIASNAERHYFVLHDLAWSNGSAGNLVGKILVERIRRSLPENRSVLRLALSILARNKGISRSTLAHIANDHATALSLDDSRFPQLMAVWLQCDPLPALAALSSRLEASPSPDRVMIGVSSVLSGHSGERNPIVQDSPLWKPAAMRTFIPLVYQHVRREDDRRRAGGGAYTPTPRDDAEFFRNGLLERLASVADPSVQQVLREFLSEPILSHCEEYIRRLIHSHSEMMADRVVWSPPDVRSFAQDYETTPKTDKDLFTIGVRRLNDLKQWVEVGEDSPREEVNPENKEAGFRRWLQRRLMDASKGRYVVPQEWELDGGVRTDLRITASGIAPITLELKIAEKYTLPELIDGLQEQLVGQYMRDFKARYGIYVLALFKRKRKWDPLQRGPRIDSETLVEILRSLITDILESRSDVFGIEVVLIHFSPPQRS